MRLSVLCCNPEIASRNVYDDMPVNGPLPEVHAILVSAAVVTLLINLAIDTQSSGVALPAVVGRNAESAENLLAAEAGAAAGTTRVAILVVTHVPVAVPANGGGGGVTSTANFDRHQRRRRRRCGYSPKWLSRRLVASYSVRAVVVLLLVKATTRRRGGEIPVVENRILATLMVRGGR